jgi:hypothetical protein
MFIKQPQQAISLQRRSTKFKHQTRPQTLPLSTCTPQSRIQCHTSRAPWPINMRNPNIFTHILQFHSTPIGRPTQPNPTPPSIPEPEHQSTHLYSDKSIRFGASKNISHDATNTARWGGGGSTVGGTCGLSDGGGSKKGGFGGGGCTVFERV